MAENKLKETKGEFNLVGIVGGMKHDNAFREGVSKKPTSKGKEWKSIRFSVQTSKTNRIFVEMMGNETDEVSAYSSEKKESKKFPWAKRNKLPDGYAILQARASLELGEKGKYEQKAMTRFDAVEYIHDNLKDGDSIYVRGKISFQTYEGRGGQTVRKTVYSIESIGKTKNPVDFDAEGFEETAGFVQNVIFDGAELDEESKKVYVSAHVVDFTGKASLGQFVVNSENNPNMAKAFLKSVGFGDTLELYGLCRNELVVAESKVENEDEEDPFNSEERPKGTTQTARSYVTELQIKGVTKDTWEKGVYTEDDFASVEAEKKYGEDKTSKEDDDPFADDDNIDDDDLPF